MTISTENFLKTIYTQSKLKASDTRLSTLAKLLHITNAAATDMARNLARKDLVNYTKYKPLSLTDKGIKMALEVIRKHRLWESFLYKTLNLSLHEIHQEAEQLEHQTSDFLSNRIDEFLGNPTVDPHGDPIPDKNGNILLNEQSRVLTLVQPGVNYVIRRLFSSDESFFDFCKSNALEIGTIIKVVKQYDSGKMTEIVINDKTIILNKEMADIIYVEESTDQ